MKIGVVGSRGVVGEALMNGFKHLKHEVAGHDVTVEGSKLEHALDSEIVYICVPTPQADDGRCGTDIVEQVVADCAAADYQGIVAVKSTVIVGTTRRLIERHDNLRICFVPEFLRERCATADFINAQDLLVIGADEEEVSKKIADSHGWLPKQTRWLSPSEAEFIKYFNNIYNACLIGLANSFYEICQAEGLDYQKIKNVATLREHIGDHYLDCNEALRGFGGACLPKDLSALNAWQKDKGLGLKLFETLLEENRKFGATVLPGMRA